jgi:hypothetical protein
VKPIDRKTKKPTFRAGQAGVALPVALVTALALVIGLGALASRTSQGFISSYFQGVNREARDVAESAIVDFGNTMNREENRLLLIAGNDQINSWSDAVHRNVCTAYNSDGTRIGGANPATVSTTALRFLRGADWQNLVDSDSSRQFRVTGVEYLYEQGSGASAVRTPFDFATQNSNIPEDTVRTSALRGGTRTLMRVTIVGRVERNQRTSFARVAREFEIVPKCCKRSFGGNGGEVAWGRDTTSCPVVDSSLGDGSGIIGGLNGGSPSGSSNTLDIRDENGDLVTQAKCWDGNLTSDSDLQGSPNPACTSGNQTLGAAGPTRPGITFTPEEFDLKLPIFPPDLTAVSLNLSGGQQQNINTIYYDPGAGKVRLRRGSELPEDLQNCEFDTSGQVNCVFSSINVGNRELRIDTSNAPINFFFDNPGFTGNYMDSGGSGAYRLVNCAPGTINCSTFVGWNEFQAQPDKFNLFTLGSGKFDINGGASVVGANIYAPYATVDIRGGGNSDPNFMGRIWSNNINLVGNVKIRTFAAQPQFCSESGTACPPTTGVPLFDIVARSFSHASGF